MLSGENKDFRLEFFENSEMLISIYNKDLDLIDANRAFLKGLRLEKKNIIGKNISEISPDCKPSGRYKIYKEILKTGKPCVIDQVQLHPSLGSIYIRLTAFKVGDGLGISSKDITDLVETIQELETFIYKTSHDIRSPIATTLGLINVGRHDLEDNATALRYLDMIKQQTERLDDIVKRLVDITKIRQERKNIQLIDFNALLANIKISLLAQDGADKVKIIFNLNVHEAFYSDLNLLDTIFRNLIHNAVKYRHEARNSMVNVSVQSIETGILIKIADNGSGINEQAQKDVFKMFFKGNNLGGGSGLGLYAVKSCVKKLDGQISLRSNPETGTTFTIHLPNAYRA